MSEWKQTEPGRLALLGSPMSIYFQPHKMGDFSIYRDGAFRQRCATLGYAKMEAERHMGELREIGAAVE